MNIGFAILDFEYLLVKIILMNEQFIDLMVLIKNSTMMINRNRPIYFLLFCPQGGEGFLVHKRLIFKENV